MTSIPTIASKLTIQEDGRVPTAPGLRGCAPEPAAQSQPEALVPSREETMFLDVNGDMIRMGDVVRAPITINQEVHGTWGEYRIRKAPGGYLFSYLRSEKGQILPEGYTGGYMAELIPDEDEQDLKTLVFTRVPIKINGWRIIRDSDAGSAGDAQRLHSEGAAARAEGIAKDTRP